MPLTPHQQEAHDKVIQLYRDGHKRVILNGGAGTGKTFTADEIVKTIKKDYTINPNYNNGTIYVTAPTNKALAVIKNRVSSSVEFKTIHSALNLTQYTNPKSGIDTFIQRKTYGKPKGNEFDKCKFALIDECSMLGKALEGPILTKEKPDDAKIIPAGYLEKYSMPVLYMGDFRQLLPVKETYSPVFEKGYPMVTLTEIMRQKGDNPIIALSNDTDLLFFKQPNIVGGKGYTYSNNQSHFIESLAEANGTDEFKYLAYSNTQIDSINQMVRHRIYSNPSRIETGETIVFNKYPYLKHYINEELKVEDLDIVTDYVEIPNKHTKWDPLGEHNGKMDRVKLKYYYINNEVKILHEHSDRMYKQLLLSVRHQCNNEDWDYRSKKYVEERIFADFKYNHAITVHKSQGSTYKQVVINIGNIMFNPSADDRQRMLYTAITRASDLIILNNVQ